MEKIDLTDAGYFGGIGIGDGERFDRLDRRISYDLIEDSFVDSKFRINLNGDSILVRRLFGDDLVIRDFFETNHHNKDNSYLTMCDLFCEIRPSIWITAESTDPYSQMYLDIHGCDRCGKGLNAITTSVTSPSICLQCDKEMEEEMEFGDETEIPFLDL